jgi:hypothetical protein
MPPYQLAEDIGVEAAVIHGEPSQHLLPDDELSDLQIDLLLKKAEASLRAHSAASAMLCTVGRDPEKRLDHTGLQRSVGP